MKIFNLGEIDERYLNLVGGKARGLDKLVREGFCVPAGFVIVDLNIETTLDKAVRYYLDSGLDRVAVRSSASAEDGVDFSFAGQFVSVLNVQGEKDLRDALAKCIASLEGATAKAYSEKFGGNKKITMNVVVQQMLKPACAGVCFTCDPSNPDNILVEAIEGVGEALVSGEACATQYCVPKNNLDASIDAAPPMSAKHLKELCAQSVQAQVAFSTPLDIEWAVQDDRLYLLQARPITTQDVCTEDEFNPKHDITGHAVTRCNISEMLPGAVTPLSIFTTVYAIDWGIRKMLHRIGANKKMKELPDFACAFPAYGHLFMDLSPLYAMSKTTLLAKKEDVDMSICGRPLGEDEQGIILGRKPWFGARLRNSIRYITYIMSQKKTRRRLKKLTDKFAIKGDCPVELYSAIDRARTVANEVAFLHYATSGFSGAMSSAVTNALNKKFNDLEKSRAVLAQLLERIDGIESVDILASLYKVANGLMARDEFMRRHGHRAIREAELRSPGWAQDEKAFDQYLKAVTESGMQKPEKQSPPDLRAIAKEHGFGGKVIYFAKKAREGVRNREFSKSKLIRVFDVFKQAYTRLAVMLVGLGRLPDQDAIYFLTHIEIKELAAGENPALVKKALQRRRLLKIQEQLSFAEIYMHMPVPLDAQTVVESGDIMRGTAVSRGMVTGSARIVKNSEDAAKLQKGEIMVASFTDIGWSPYYCLIDGLVTEVGGALSHGAVVAREYALPLVSNIVGATQLIKTGDIITVDGGAGTVRKV